MLTNTWIKKHMEVLSGQIDNTVYERKDLYEGMTLIKQTLTTENELAGIHNACISNDGKTVLRWKQVLNTSNNNNDSYLELIDINTHELIKSQISWLPGGQEDYYFHDSYQSPTDHCYYFLWIRNSLSGGNDLDELWIGKYDPETLSAIQYYKIGKLADLDDLNTWSENSTGQKGFVGPHFREFSENIVHIITYGSYDTGADPGFIRAELTNVEEDGYTPTMRYWYRVNFEDTDPGTGTPTWITTENALDAIVVEDYTIPNKINYNIKFYLVDGYSQAEIDEFGKATPKFTFVEKGFWTDPDIWEAVINNKTWFIFRNVITSGEDKADFMVIGKGGRTYFNYSITTDSLPQFLCEFRVLDDLSANMDWWPYDPTQADADNAKERLIMGEPMLSKNKDLVFVISNWNSDTNTHDKDMWLYTLNAVGLHEITKEKWQDLPDENATIVTSSRQLHISASDFTKLYFNLVLDGDIDTQATQNTILVDTKLSTGTNTLEGLNIIEHSYGIGEKPLDPNDVKLEEELARKELLNKFAYENLFISQTNLLEDELNGFNLYEFGTHSQNNILVSRDSINRYKDESMILSFEKQIRNTGRRQRETKYMQNELTKFYSGIGVLENVKINSLEFMLDENVITSVLPILVEHKNDTELELTFTVTTTNAFDINRLRLVNTTNIPLQDVKLAATRHLNANSEYTLKINLKGEEI